MTEDFVVIDQDRVRGIYADFSEAQRAAEDLCHIVRRAVHVYGLKGTAKPKMVWPVQFNNVPSKKRR